MSFPNTQAFQKISKYQYTACHVDHRFGVNDIVSLRDDHEKMDCVRVQLGGVLFKIEMLEK